MFNKKGLGVVAMVIIGVIVLGLIVGGVFLMGGSSNNNTNNCNGTNYPNGTICSGGSSNSGSSIADAYSGNCDLSKVSKISKSAGKYTTEYDVSGSKITMNGQDASILNGVVCIPGIGGELSLYLSSGGNTDGKWFTITVGSKTTNLNIKEISVNGAKVLVMEDRVATVFSGNAAMPAGNYIYIRQREIYRSTLLTYKFVSMYVPGTDLMLDKSFEEIGGANAGPDKYTPTTFTYS